jgi:hypothetical protein
VILEYHAQPSAKCGDAARLYARGILVVDENLAAVGRSMSAINFKMLLLPAPEWPVKNASSPASI